MSRDEFAEISERLDKAKRDALEAILTLNNLATNLVQSYSFSPKQQQALLEQFRNSLAELQQVLQETGVTGGRPRPDPDIPTSGGSTDRKSKGCLEKAKLLFLGGRHPR